MRQVKWSWFIAMVALLAWGVARPVSAQGGGQPAPIIVVFDIEATGVELRPEVLNALADYLATRVAEGGRYQVMPRAEVKVALAAAKTESYKECYDESCQIELGRELAAQKSLATRVVRLGSQCRVALNVFDLKKSASEAAATASGACSEDGIVSALDQAVARLTGSDGTMGARGAGSSGASGAEQWAPMLPQEAAGPRVSRTLVTEAHGDLAIMARTPSGAEVLLEVTDPSGGLTRSSSPYKNSHAAIGKWKVTARAKGHEPEVLDFVVPPDDLTAVRIELKIQGGLKIFGEPTGATVKVTGPEGFEDEAGLPWAAEGLPRGSYRVEVSRPGYEGFSRVVAVEPGRTSELPVHLSRVGSPGAVSAGQGGLEWVTLPGGTFEMGSRAESDEKPIRRVTLRAFEMTRTEVTIGQYRQCVEAGACSAPGKGSGCNWEVPGRDSHPVNCVDWNQAQSFAKWVGGRLPTEAEWEYAARGGEMATKFPWGKEKADCTRAVMDDGDGMGCGRGPGTWPVCSMPAGNSPLGLCDLAGNVWEWVQDWYKDSYKGAASDGSAWESPPGTRRVSRGGCWNCDSDSVRGSFRGSNVASARFGFLGFRLARSL